MNLPEEARRALDEVTTRRIKEALRRSEGNRSAAAIDLQISRSTLYRDLRRLGLLDWSPFSELPPVSN